MIFQGTQHLFAKAHYRPLPIPHFAVWRKFRSVLIGVVSEALPVSEFATINVGETCTGFYCYVITPFARRKTEWEIMKLTPRQWTENLHRREKIPSAKKLLTTLLSNTSTVSNHCLGGSYRSQSGSLMAQISPSPLLEVFISFCYTNDSNLYCFLPRELAILSIIICRLWSYPVRKQTRSLVDNPF